MATANGDSTRSSNDDVTSTTTTTNTTPLLTRSNSSPRRTLRTQTLQSAARFLRRASSNRMVVRESSLLVRETAAEQLEETQSDWAYSKPVVVLDMFWNSAFIALSIVVLILSRDEKPGVPLRVWILGYALQCLVHMVCVMVEFNRRRSGGLVTLSPTEEDPGSSIAKNVEFGNTVFSFVWWVIGFYWSSAGGEALATDCPQLYWLSVIFLAFDVFFVVFCIAVACLIGVAVCCCLPCIIALLYAVADQQGASKEDIEQLTKYKFRKNDDVEKVKGSSGGIMTECNTDTPMEHDLSEEDAECCICLSSYDDGVELRELPCNHHFHCTCIDKWLLINATCPLCKYNILKSSIHDREEV